MVVTVPGSDDVPWSYRWFIDGRPLTAEPVLRANQLVLYLDQVVPGHECAVVVYKDTQTVVSQALNLTAAANAQIGAAPGSSNNLSTTNNSFGPSPDNESASSSSGGASPVFSSVVPAGNSVLVNLSTRAQIKAGAPLIVGLIIGGSVPKPILIRAVGPTLANYGVTDALSNPTLTLYHDGVVLKQNDDWDSSAAAGVNAATQAIRAFPLASGGRDAALMVELPPGAYTAHVNSADNTPGTALVEFYDLSAATVGLARLINLSARGYSKNGNDVLIVGFIVSGDRPKTVLVRALGPMLAQYGVSNYMPDPKLELHAGDPIVAENDNWSTDALAVTDATQAARAVSLPNGSRDAALVARLNPGAYTAIVTTGSSSGSGGEALVEVYELP